MALGAAAVYVATLITQPLLDPGLNVLTAHPEDYAAGRFGFLVNASYVALAIALAGLTVSFLPVRRWAIAVPVLLVAGSVMCLALAFDPIGIARGQQWAILPVVGLAAAPLVATFSLRDRQGTRSGAAIALGVAVALAFVGLLAAPDSIGGAVNRAFDVLLGLWVALAAQLSRAPRR